MICCYLEMCRENQMHFSYWTNYLPFQCIATIDITMKVYFCLISIFLCSWWRSSESAQPLPFVRPDFGRWVIPTVGQVWPKPQQQTYGQNVFVLRPLTFQFRVSKYCQAKIMLWIIVLFIYTFLLQNKISGQRCGIIEDAINRYYNIIFYRGNSKIVKETSNVPKSENAPQSRAILDTVDVTLRLPCETYPYEGMLESCKWQKLFKC